MGAKVEWDNSSRAVIIRTESDSNIIGVEKPIDFEVVNKQGVEENELISKWYQNNYKTEGFHSIIDEDWMYVLVSAGEKTTGGYSLKVDSITEVTSGTAYVHATLNSPDKDAIVTQALTYPNVVVRFHKGDIEEIGKAIPVDSIEDEGSILLNQTDFK